MVFSSIARRELDPRLIGVELLVATVLFGDGPIARATLDTATFLEYEYLVGAPDRAQPVRDDECSPAGHETSKTFLYHESTWGRVKALYR